MTDSFVASASVRPEPNGVEAVALVLWNSTLLQPARGPWDGIRSATWQCCESAARDVLVALAAPASPKWRTVETAPKDGTPIIGAFFDIRWADSHRKNDIVRCWWQPEFEAFISSCRQMTMAPGYTINGKSSELHSPVVEPITHWVPLPELSESSGRNLADATPSNPPSPEPDKRKPHGRGSGALRDRGPAATEAP